MCLDLPVSPPSGTSRRLLQLPPHLFLHLPSHLYLSPRASLFSFLLLFLLDTASVCSYAVLTNSSTRKVPATSQHRNHCVSPSILPPPTPLTPHICEFSMYNASHKPTLLPTLFTIRPMCHLSEPFQLLVSQTP